MICYRYRIGGAVGFEMRMYSLDLARLKLGLGTGPTKKCKGKSWPNTYKRP